LLEIEIRNQGVRFLTDATVAYTLEANGMGLSFVNVPANELSILEHWLSSPGESTGRGIARRIEVVERDGFRREILIRHGSSAAGRRTTCSLHAYRVKNAGHPVWES
jgi:hypothetical protein